MLTTVHERRRDTDEGGRVKGGTTLHAPVEKLAGQMQTNTHRHKERPSNGWGELPMHVSATAPAPSFPITAFRLHFAALLLAPTSLGHQLLLLRARVYVPNHAFTNITPHRSELSLPACPPALPPLLEIRNACTTSLPRPRCSRGLALHEKAKDIRRRTRESEENLGDEGSSHSSGGACRMHAERDVLVHSHSQRHDPVLQGGSLKSSAVSTTQKEGCPLLGGRECRVAGSSIA